MTTAGRDQPDRNETPTERLDRNWGDLLQEMRVMQTGVQLIAGFLLTLPFQEAFGDLDDLQRTVYLGLVGLATTISALMLVPIALHRRLFRDHTKESLVVTAHRLVIIALFAIGLLIVGINWLIFDVVLSHEAGYTASALSLVVAASLLIWLPASVERRALEEKSA